MDKDDKVLYYIKVKIENEGNVHGGIDLPKLIFFYENELTQLFEINRKLQEELKNKISSEKNDSGKKEIKNSSSLFNDNSESVIKDLKLQIESLEIEKSNLIKKLEKTKPGEILESISQSKLLESEKQKVINKLNEEKQKEIEKISKQKNDEITKLNEQLRNLEEQITVEFEIEKENLIKRHAVFYIITTGHFRASSKFHNIRSTSSRRIIFKRKETEEGVL